MKLSYPLNISLSCLFPVAEIAEIRKLSVKIILMSGTIVTWTTGTAFVTSNGFFALFVSKTMSGAMRPKKVMARKISMMISTLLIISYVFGKLCFVLGNVTGTGTWLCFMFCFEYRLILWMFYLLFKYRFIVSYLELSFMQGMNDFMYLKTASFHHGKSRLRLTVSLIYLVERLLLISYYTLSKPPLVRQLSLLVHQAATCHYRNRSVISTTV